MIADGSGLNCSASSLTISVYDLLSIVSGCTKPFTNWKVDGSNDDNRRVSF